MRTNLLNPMVAITLCLAGAGAAVADEFDLALSTDLLTPSFRGAANTTYVGWDLFDDGGSLDDVINDTTPDLGVDPGSFVTTNAEDHLSGSLNYYSGAGSVAEQVTFTTDPGAAGGFTTVIVQANTLFGEWGTDIDFGPIDGVLPVQVLQSGNSRFNFGSFGASLFAKYEVPGNVVSPEFSISSAADSTISIDRFVVDTLWSADGYADITAIATPEPSCLLLMVASLCGFAARRRAV